MELFTLLAKLALDKKDYDKAIQEAKAAGQDIEVPSPSLTLDDEDFTTAISDANAATVNDKDASLDLDDADFTSGIDDANEAEVDDPDDPNLDLDDTDFQTGIDAANEAEVSDPDTPQLGLDHQEFDQGISDVEDGAGDFEGTVGSIFQNIKGAIVASGVAAVLSQIAGLLKESVDLAASTGDAIDKGSIAMGLTTHAYQQWDHALKQSGGSVNDLRRGLMSFRQILGDASNVTQEEQAALNDLNIELTKADGYKKTRNELKAEVQAMLNAQETTEKHGETIEALNNLLSDNITLTDDQASAFRTLGLNVKNSDGSLKTSQQLMEESLAALAAYQGEDRDSIVDTLFGRNAGSIKALIAGGLEPMVDLLNEADDLGLVMSDEEIKNAVAYGDAMANLQEEINGIKTSFVQDLMPVLTDAVKNLTLVLSFFNPRLGKSSLAEQGKEIDDQLGADLLTIEGTSEAAKELIEKLFSMGDATKLTAKQQKEWKKTAEWLIKNIPSLSGVINLDTMEINANKQAIEDTIKQWKQLSIERAKAQALSEKRAALEAKETEWFKKENEAYDLEQQAREKEKEVEILAKRDFNAMPEDAKQRLAGKFGLESPEQLSFGQILAALGNYNMEWGFSYYGSQELKKAEAEQGGVTGSLADRARKAREEADALQKEVEQGQADMAGYEKRMDEIYNNLFGDADESKKKVDEVNDSLKNLPDEKTVYLNVVTNGVPTAFPKAIGSRYVPYDNYPAILHRGEEVLTASEARRRSESGNDLGALGGIVARAIKEGMEQANVNTYVTDREVSKGANRWNGQRLDAGRFSTW